MEPARDLFGRADDPDNILVRGGVGVGAPGVLGTGAEVFDLIGCKFEIKRGFGVLGLLFTFGIAEKSS